MSGCTVTKRTTSSSGGVTSVVLEMTEKKQDGTAVTIERSSKSTASAFVERELIPGYERHLVKTPPVTFALPATRKLADRPMLSSGNLKQEIPLSAEKFIVDEINELRRDPAAYSRKLALRQRVDMVGNTLWSKDTAIRIGEGAALMVELVLLLSETAPLPLLETPLVDGLCLAAQDLCRDHGPRALTGQKGTDESTVQQRVSRYGTWIDGCVELVSYSVYEPVEVICQLLLDDSVPSRWHRKALLNPMFCEVGVCVAPHAATNVMSSIVLCGRFIQKPRGDQVTAFDAVSYTMAALDGRCSHCFAKVDPKKCVFGLLGRQYHRHCFLCRVCKSTLREAFYTHDGEAYCPGCLVFRHRPKCTKCTAPLANSTETYKVNGSILCEECFLDHAVFLTGYKHNRPITEDRKLPSMAVAPAPVDAPAAEPTVAAALPKAVAPVAEAQESSASAEGAATGGTEADA